MCTCVCMCVCNLSFNQNSFPKIGYILKLVTLIYAVYCNVVWTYKHEDKQKSQGPLPRLSPSPNNSTINSNINLKISSIFL